MMMTCKTRSNFIMGIATNLSPLTTNVESSVIINMNFLKKAKQNGFSILTDSTVQNNCHFRLNLKFKIFKLLLEINYFIAKVLIEFFF